MAYDVNKVAWWDDAVIGDKRVSKGRTVRWADVNGLAGLSGSYEPLHCNDEFGKTTAYGQCVVNGLLSLVIAEGLRGNYIWYNGDDFRTESLIGFLGLNNAKFMAPLFVGDTIHVETTIASKKATSKPGRGTITFLDQIINQNGVVTAQWERTSLYKMRPTE